MKKLILSLICLAAAWGAAAKVELPEIIGSDMVLQQNAQCRLWGWADPRATVRIETSWGAECTVRSDADGRWSARVDTPAGSYEPQQVTIAKSGSPAGRAIWRCRSAGSITVPSPGPTRS